MTKCESETAARILCRRLSFPMPPPIGRPEQLKEHFNYWIRQLCVVNQLRKVLSSAVAIIFGEKIMGLSS